MAQEGGLQERLDDQRDLLILWGVPDDREEAEREHYEQHVQRLEDVET